MKESIVEFFGNYAHIIVFIHVISAVTLIGGVIYLYHILKGIYAIENFETKKSMTNISLDKFMKPSIASIVLLIITAGIMAIGLGFRQGDPALYAIVHIKEGLWTLITILFYILYRFVKNSEINSNEEYEIFFEKLKKVLFAIAIFGSVAIYLGVKLRGF
jgi:uncharacterized membrane protein